MYSDEFLHTTRLEIFHFSDYLFNSCFQFREPCFGSFSFVHLRSGQTFRFEISDCSQGRHERKKKDAPVNGALENTIFTGASQLNGINSSEPYFLANSRQLTAR